MASPAPRISKQELSLRQELQDGLAACATEADVVQVLYAELHPRFGYDSINLQVLEREGWYHSVPIERGVLQDVRRRQLAESNFARNFEDPRIAVISPEYEGVSFERGRGPGVSRRPQVLIWVPVMHQGRAVGAISYQTYARRRVPNSELEFLSVIHAQLGVVVSNAYLNELTRNQALSLSALNEIARALSVTLKETEVALALHRILARLLPLDLMELILPETAERGRARVLGVTREGRVQEGVKALRSRQLETARSVLAMNEVSFEPRAQGGYRASIWVPVLEGGQVRGVLALHAAGADAYEESTGGFLAQVADQVWLALRNVRSFQASEAQRRRMEVVNAVGTRLASTLDRWAIMRAVREELANHLEFDLFSVATVSETSKGPVAEGYVYDSGVEESVPAVPLATAGPSRQAYETGLPVLIRRSPWAKRAEGELKEKGRLFGEGALITVTRHRSGRVATRSIVWVPVRHGERISALLSLQSYRAGAFNEWHVQLLQDVAAQVGLALANADYFAALQTERRRLEALHLLETGLAGAADEHEMAQAVFRALGFYVAASQLVFCWVDSLARLTGFGSQDGEEATPLSPVAVAETFYFRRLAEAGSTLAEPVSPAVRRSESRHWWHTPDSRSPAWVLWVPVTLGDRVVAALSAQRFEDRPFEQAEVQLVESAAPLVGIALRTVRLHRANEMALAQSVRIQEVAALAGHDLAGVVASIADQARTVFSASGAACWAFDDEGKPSARAVEGEMAALQVLDWSSAAGTSAAPPVEEVAGTTGEVAWRLTPLGYADRLVGAIGTVQARVAGEDASGTAATDFARHAAIAIENARLAAETRGRIHTLEAIADLTNLDITHPERAADQMGRVIERALSSASGALWLAADGMLRRHPSALGASPVGSPSELLGRPPSPGALASDRVVIPITLDGEVVGALSAELTGTSAAETRRLMAVLAGQAAVVLNRMRLVDALDRQATMMNAILSHSPVGVILEDARGTVVYANPEIERIYGVPASALVGMPSHHLWELAGEVQTAAPEGDRGAGSEIRLARSGTVVELRQVPIPGSASQPAGLLTMHEDVTSEREILEAKDLMLRAIGHEVRSPAAAMKSTIAGLMQWNASMPPEERQHLLAQAYEQSDRLLSLVENQLIISKLETRQFEPSPEAVPVQRAVEHVKAVLRSRYGSRVASIAYEEASSLPDAWCEPTHLDQVLSNLIGNALEYTRAAKVRVSASPHGDQIEVAISDDGAGLPAERVEGLFQKTSPAGRNRARGGLGLGLYLSRLLVERSLGGRIWLERTGTEGTIFKFTVQAARPGGEAGEEAAR